MIQKLLLYLLLLLLIIVTLLYITGHSYIFTAINRTYLQGNVTANIDDHQQFKTNLIAAATPQKWAESNNKKTVSNSFKQQMKANDGVAYVVIHNGELVTEHYEAGYKADSKTNSFSMAKTVITLLVGKAIEDGYIKSWDQPLTDFLPEFNEDVNGRLATIGSLSTMTSGYDWDEHYYSPFSPTVELLYSDNVADFLFERKFTSKPEDNLYYSSASTQLLTIVLNRALAKKDPKLNTSTYLSQTFWKPLGMNDDALWHTDEQSLELGYCCLNTNARNFAKLGQLMLQNGQWNGQQLIAQEFIQRMSQPHKASNYGYSTWINNKYQYPYYAFRGHLGQFIIVIPEKQLVIVRLGQSLPLETLTAEDIYIQEALRLISN